MGSQWKEEGFVKIVRQNFTTLTEILEYQRFFDQVGHETMYASNGNKHFFTKSCLRQTYQNYEQPTQTSENSNLSKKIFYEEYLTRGLTCIKKCFGKF